MNYDYDSEIKRFRKKWARTTASEKIAAESSRSSLYGFLVKSGLMALAQKVIEIGVSAVLAYLFR
jgi:hypothetical protein